MDMRGRRGLTKDEAVEQMARGRLLRMIYYSSSERWWLYTPDEPNQPMQRVNTSSAQALLARAEVVPVIGCVDALAPVFMFVGDA